MKVDELMNQARDAISVKRVYGEPYEKNGTTVIPAATVMGGGGGGEGSGPMAGLPAEAGVADATAAGAGAGFGVRAMPAGAYVIKDGEVTWVPALDLGRVIFVGQIVAIVALLVARSILKSRRD
jgi:uncharacterized spore protein YtfJ